MSLSELWTALLNGLGQALAFFYDLIPNYGVAIILLTVAVKIVTLPLTIKSTKSMQAMQKMQPEIKRIQAKFKGDRQKVQEETMKLYKEHGVNPAGGCLPLLLQMPVFFALFQVFQRCGVALKKGAACPPNQIGVATLPMSSALRVAITSGSAGFLGMQLGLSPLAAFREGGVLTSVPYFLLILFMAATSWYQQKQMAASQTGPPNPQTQMMSRIMVLVFPVLAVNWPIALTLYWTVNNLWTIGQQYFLLGDGKAGGWLARLPAPLGPRGGVAATGESTGGNPAPASSSPRHKGSGARKGKKRR